MSKEPTAQIHTRIPMSTWYWMHETVKQGNISQWVASLIESAKAVKQMGESSEEKVLKELEALETEIASKEGEANRKRIQLQQIRFDNKEKRKKQFEEAEKKNDSVKPHLSEIDF